MSSAPEAPPGLVIAHVAQEAPAEDKAAVEYVIDGDEEYRRIESAIEAAERQHDGTALANLHMQFETIGGYSAKARAAALMKTKRSPHFPVVGACA